jgi:uncharacterized membrane protein (DUF2068 family)
MYDKFVELIQSIFKDLHIYSLQQNLGTKKVGTYKINTIC